MKNRGMLILLLIFGILCISVKVSEEDSTLPLLRKFVELENQTSENGDSVTADNDMSDMDNESERNAMTEQTVTETATTDGTADEPTKCFQILHTETTQKIRVLLSAEHKGTYLQPQITVTADTDYTKDEQTVPESVTVYTAAKIPERGCRLQTDGKFRLTFGDSEDSRTFSGILYLYAKDTKVYAVHEVDLEEYTANVVPGEMPAYYPEEALKAQAVCARTYALHHLDGRKEQHADVDDTVACQVYNNIGRKKKTDQATSATQGEIIANAEGHAAQLYFYSTSYGFCSKDDIWNEKPETQLLRQSYLGTEKRQLASEKDFSAYIRKEDMAAWEGDAPWFRWQLTIPAQTLQVYCREKEPTAGAVTDIQVTKRASGFAAKELTVTCGGQTVVIEGEYAIREFLSPDGLPLKNQDETVWDKKVLPSSYFTIEVTRKDGALTAITLYGGGFGHGAGMSQNAAKTMAESGMSYTQILSGFFDIQ